MTKARIALLIAGMLAISFNGASAQASPDDSPTGAQTQAVQKSGLGAAAYGPPTGAWSRTYYGSDAHIGGTKKPAIGVSWAIGVVGSNARACVKARGYRWSDGKAYWVSLGCGTSGGGSVHWGKDGGYGVSGKTAVKVKSVYIGTGAPIKFTS